MIVHICQTPARAYATYYTLVNFFLNPLSVATRNKKSTLTIIAPIWSQTIIVADMYWGRPGASALWESNSARNLNTVLSFPHGLSLLETGGFSETVHPLATTKESLYVNLTFGTVALHIGISNRNNNQLLQHKREQEMSTNQVRSALYVIRGVQYLLG